ncbi:PleD family two-component system response regulator [Planctomycetota bacterium]
MANVLCVDDEKNILTVMRKVLEKASLNVTTETNPVKGLEAATQGNFDLFIIDIMMPEMNGYELCKELKENDHTKNVPIIFLTAKNEISDMLEGYYVGAHIYLSKPFNSKIFLERVLELLKGAKED